MVTRAGRIKFKIVLFMAFLFLFAVNSDVLAAGRFIVPANTTFEGGIGAGVVPIEVDGQLKGNIFGFPEEVIVRGGVDGDIGVDATVYLKPGAVVNGDISAGKLVRELGSEFNGKFTSRSEPSSPPFYFIILELVPILIFIGLSFIIQRFFFNRFETVVEGCKGRGVLLFGLGFMSMILWIGFLAIINGFFTLFFSSGQGSDLGLETGGFSVPTIILYFLAASPLIISLAVFSRVVGRFVFSRFVDSIYAQVILGSFLILWLIFLSSFLSIVVLPVLAIPALTILGSIVVTRYGSFSLGRPNKKQHFYLVATILFMVFMIIIPASLYIYVPQVYGLASPNYRAGQPFEINNLSFKKDYIEIVFLEGVGVPIMLDDNLQGTVVLGKGYFNFGLPESKEDERISFVIDRCAVLVSDKDNGSSLSGRPASISKEKVDEAMVSFDLMSRDVIRVPANILGVQFFDLYRVVDVERLRETKGLNSLIYMISHGQKIVYKEEKTKLNGKETTAITLFADEGFYVFLTPDCIGPFE
ncbi:MAG TPA: polymer-forming cytoskeletal protein [Actinobacteria bacterium]|nr:polymer-forming cytoskeletal protein [Actinomycetota bacterium]